MKGPAVPGAREPTEVRGSAVPDAQGATEVQGPAVPDAREATEVRDPAVPGARESTEARRPDSVRAHNTALVLGLLRTGGLVSRADLARETGLSLPTVMDIVERLCAQGLVRQAGSGTPAGGRPPRLYEFTPGSRMALGISIGTATTTALLTDLNATVLHEVREPSRLREGPEACVEQVTRLLDVLLARGAERQGTVIGIGLAVAAHLRDSEGRRLRPWDDPGLAPLDLRALVAERYGVPVDLDNYAKAVAVGEHRFGAARGHRHVLCVVLQDGVGAALITGGALHRGWDGAAGRFGATLVPGPDGERTTLDAVAGAAGIVARAARAMRAASGAAGPGVGSSNGAGTSNTADPAGTSGAGSMSSSDPMSPSGAGPVRSAAGPSSLAEVCAAAEEGNPGAVLALREVGELLGDAVHNACMLADPEVVVLTGPTVVAAGDHLVGPTTRAVTGGGRRRVVTGALGERAGAIGAVALLLRNSFIDPLRVSTG